MKQLFLTVTFILACIIGFAQGFAGNFSGQMNGVATSADLKVEANNLKGVFIIDGSSGRLSGTVNGNSAAGTINDDETGAVFTFIATFSGNEVVFKLSQTEAGLTNFPVVMKRKSGVVSKSSNETETLYGGSRDARLTGIWRNTEVLSSGGFSDSFNMATDNFIQFNKDGTGFTWTGKSAGGSSDASFSASEGEKHTFTWRTNGKTLIFKDKNAKEPASLLFSADETGLMLYNNNSSNKKIFQRVQ